jgi:hypothetical protein
VSAFPKPLTVTLLDDRKGLWRIVGDFPYQSDLLGRTLVVPNGFVTDFASGPRLVQGLLTVATDAGRPIAVVHDWLYSTQAVDRATADAVLREGMLALGWPGWVAESFYLAVREFGQKHWDKPNVPQTPAVSLFMETSKA